MVLRADSETRLPPRPAGPIYRPLLVGAAILHRLPAALDGRRRWQVDLAPDGRLLPDTPGRVADIERVVAWRRAAGDPCRVGAALFSAYDLDSLAPIGSDDRETADPTPSEGRVRPPVVGLWPRRASAIEMYGWALMYQLPGAGQRAWVDGDDDHDALPAFYESPLELLDRASYLAERGVPSRPIALVTRPEDFLDAPSGPVNRFFPDAFFRRPADLRRIL